MDNSHFGNDSKIVKNSARGYSQTKKGYANAEFIRILIPKIEQKSNPHGGGLRATVTLCLPSVWIAFLLISSKTVQFLFIIDRCSREGFWAAQVKG